jgi:molecular chaperone HscA
VAAREQVSGVEAQINVKPSYGLSDDQIARMLQESFSTAQVDMRARALVEARVDAQRLVLATQSALQADGDLLSAQERVAVDTAIAALQTSAQGDDAALIEATSKTLAQVTEAFAAQRMNRGIAKALSGHTLDSLQDSFKT